MVVLYILKYLPALFLIFPGTVSDNLRTAVA